MAKKKDAENDREGGEMNGNLSFLTSEQEIADYLKMSLYEFRKINKKYPFKDSGVPVKIMGRYRITTVDANLWFGYVQRQELRHPDARRMRPEEPPALTEIKGR